MKYPKYEEKKALRKLESENDKKEAKIYVDSENFSEFILKREIAELNSHKLVFNDKFRMLYFFQNGNRWLYDAYHDWPIPLNIVCMFAIFIATTISIALYTNGFHLASCLILFFTASLSIVDILYTISVKAAKAADDCITQIS